MPRINPGRILFEDEHLLAVNKLPQELSVAAPGEVRKLALADFLRKQYPGIRVVHRLDFGTSGVLVFARSAAVLEHIRESKFAGWVKTYRALAAGNVVPREGEIRAKVPARTGGGHRLTEALTRYRVLGKFGVASFVECSIETGRRHQIRRHLKHIGHPLLNDPDYGDHKADRAFQRVCGFKRYFLHASSVAFTHPVTGEAVRIAAPLPPAFERALEKLRQRR